MSKKLLSQHIGWRKISEGVQYDDIDAVFVHNNAYDTILVNNGSCPAFTAVDYPAMRDFVNHAYFDNWSAPETWMDHGDNILQAAAAYGDIVAYWANNKLIIVDNDVWQNRLDFYNIL